MPVTARRARGRLCACGCGSRVTQGKTYLRGHNFRTAAWKERFSSQVLSLSCRRCGKETQKTRSEARELVSYDPNDGTFLCYDCTGMVTREAGHDYRQRFSNAGKSKVEVRCRVCGSTKEYSRGKLAAISTLQELDGVLTFLCFEHRQIERRRRVKVTCWRCGIVREYHTCQLPATVRETETGLTFLCRSCSARENLRAADAKFLATFGVHSGANERDRLQARLDHAAWMIEDMGGLHALRKKGDAGRRKARSQKGRDHLSLSKITNAKRSGKFDLCPLCHKLKYTDPCRVRAGAVGFHKLCFQAWLSSKEFTDWTRKLRSRRASFYADRRPLPPPPVGRRSHPEVLANQFRWLLRHFALGESWAKIGTSEGYTRAAVQLGVSAFIELLPDSWSVVFGGQKAGKQLDKLFSVDRVRRAHEAGASVAKSRLPS